MEVIDTSPITNTTESTEAKMPVTRNTLQWTDFLQTDTIYDRKHSDSQVSVGNIQPLLALLQPCSKNKETVE